MKARLNIELTKNELVSINDTETNLIESVNTICAALGMKTTTQPTMFERAKLFVGGTVTKSETVKANGLTLVSTLVYDTKTLNIDVSISSESEEVFIEVMNIYGKMFSLITDYSVNVINQTKQLTSDINALVDSYSKSK